VEGLKITMAILLSLSDCLTCICIISQSKFPSDPCSMCWQPYHAKKHLVSAF